jgi:hypothetical protein
MRAQRRAIALMLSALIMVVGCDSRSGEVIAKTVGDHRPAGWVSECVGRWVVDVPPPIDFGGADDLEENSSKPGVYLSGSLKGGDRGAGSFSIAGVNFYETDQASSRDVFSKYSSGTLSWLALIEKRDERRAKKEAVALSVAPLNGLGWLGQNAYGGNFFLDADMRARFFRGTTATPPMGLVDGKLVPLQAEGYKEADAKRALAQSKVVVSDFLPRYTPRLPGAIPTAAGICTPYGFFADPPKSTERDYVFDMRFRDPKHSNLILGISIKTRNEQTTGTSIQAKNIRDEVTPWDYEREHARKQKKDCRSQQGTASRDILGCAFSGMTSIRKHRDVEYIKLANGQEARVLVMEYAAALSEYTAYDVLIETAGVESSATEPRIVISARGIDAETQEPALRGRQPPSIDVALQYARDLAMSLRPRPGAVDPARLVVDSLAGVR